MRVFKKLVGHRFFKRGVIMLGITALSVVSVGAMERTYAIEVGGEVVAYAENIQQVQQAVAGAQRTASQALGYDYSMEGSVSTILASARPEAAEMAELEAKVLDALSEVVSLNVVYVDGAPLCGVAEDDAAEAVLDAMLVAEMGEQTASCGFVQTVRVERAYVPAQLEVPVEALPALLEEAVQVKRAEQISTMEIVDFETVTIEDDTLYIGETVTETVGETGLNEVTRAYTYVDGVLESEAVVNTRTVKEPVQAVVRVGTRECKATGTYIWPTSGLVTSEFGYRTGFGSSYHEGIDIANDYGTDIYAADGGVVVMAEEYYGYGYLIEIEHINGESTRYAHLSSMGVEVGDEVDQGQYIGAMGETGVASGVHLHFEVRIDGEPINPREVLD